MPSRCSPCSRAACTSRSTVRWAWAIQGVCELTEVLPSAAHTVASAISAAGDGARAGPGRPAAAASYPKL